MPAVHSTNKTPIFSRLMSENRIERVPVIEVIKRQPKEIILTALARMAEQAPFYIFTAFVFTYGTMVLPGSRDLLLIALLTATVLSFVVVPLSGHLSDRIGRKRMCLIGAVTMGVWGFVYFALLNTAVPGWIFLAIVLSLVPHDMMWGPQAALIAECFTPRLRYSGFSLGFHISSITAGGRIGMHVFEEMGVPPDADFYICGPAAFMSGLVERVRISLSRPLIIGVWPCDGRTVPARQEASVVNYRGIAGLAQTRRWAEPCAAIGCRYAPRRSCRSPIVDRCAYRCSARRSSHFATRAAGWAFSTSFACTDAPRWPSAVLSAVLR